MNHPDTSRTPVPASLQAHLALPFYDEGHRALAQTLWSWAQAMPAVDHEDTDRACRQLVRQLGDAGFLRYCVPAAHGGALPELDSRSLCLIRETLARHDGLADFAFAMQGLGTGAITLAGREQLSGEGGGVGRLQSERGAVDDERGGRQPRQGVDQLPVERGTDPELSASWYNVTFHAVVAWLTMRGLPTDLRGLRPKRVAKAIAAGSGTAAPSSSASPAAVRSWSAKRTVPAVGVSSPPRMLSSVDLPLPDGPSSTMNSPRWTSRSTSRNATTSPAPVA